jgi:hypothetical protein
LSELAPTARGDLVDPLDAAFADWSRNEQAAAFKAGFWSGHERIADAMGCDLVVKKSAARWDDTRHPPMLLEATIRFKRPGYKKPKRRKA